jgi:hypothetical protein
VQFYRAELIFSFILFGLVIVLLETRRAFPVFQVFGFVAVTINRYSAEGGIFL